MLSTDGGVKLTHRDLDLLNVLREFPDENLRRLHAKIFDHPLVTPNEWGYFEGQLDDDGAAIYGCLIGISFTEEEFKELNSYEDSNLRKIYAYGADYFPGWAVEGDGQIRTRIPGRQNDADYDAEESEFDINRTGDYVLSNERMEHLRELVTIEEVRRGI